MNESSRAGCIAACGVVSLLAIGSGEPSSAESPPDLSGVYRAGRANSPCGLDGRFSPSADCPLTGRALSRIATVTQRDDPGLRCEPDALSRLFTRLPRPMEILQRKNSLEFHYQYFGIRRTIHMEPGAAPPAGTPHTLEGYSVGHWEGETLVVETTHLKENLFTLPSSADLRAVERYKRKDDGSLELRVTLVDPIFYERPLELGTASFTPTPQDYIGPWSCTNEEALFGNGKFDIDTFFEQSEKKSGE